MNKGKFYITTAIPYVNAKPHIGHALEFVQADVVARYKRSLGKDILLLSGSDENALKNVQAAEQAGKAVAEFIDENAKLFQNLAEKLNVKFDVFQKGSTIQHHKSSQKLWEQCSKDIYKKEYKGLYCVGCEQFYEKEELDENGECFEHPGKKLEEVSEENYFFRLSRYTDQIKKIIDEDTVKIIPDTRKNEILSFLRDGLKDISISRSNERAKNWGVSVLGDDTQKMYVWFDALNIYRSGADERVSEESSLAKRGGDKRGLNYWWPPDLHVIGKGILRFHAVYWLAFLLSANLELPKAIFVHEYITINGQKMSKSLGNVIDPVELIEKYGADAVRYYLLAKISPFSDGDFSEEKFIESYNADLANGLGNLVARVAKLCEKNKIHAKDSYKVWCADVEKGLSEYKFNEAIQAIWVLVREADKKINEDKPWTLTGDELEKTLEELIKRIQEIAFNLRPFLPDTAKKIEEQFKDPKIKSSEPLFPRI